MGSGSRERQGGADGHQDSPAKDSSLRGPKGEAGRLVEALGVQGRRDALGKAGWPQGWGAGRRLQTEQGLPGIWGKAQVRSEENGYLLDAQTVLKSLP